MQRVILFLLLLFLPSAALADGMVVPTIAYPAQVTIPDQRALICFSNGVERLVIETRFTGAGTDFAWVVPLPGRPVIEEATRGLFPTLQYLFRPRIITDVPQYFPWVSLLIWIAYVLLFVRPTGRITGADMASCVLVAVCIALVRGSDAVPDSVRIALGVIVFLFLMAFLALIRHAKRATYGLAVALLSLFIVFQFLLANAYMTSYQAGSLLEEPGTWFLSALDVILIMSLIIWRNAPGVVGAVVLVFLMAFALLFFLPVLATSKSRSMSAASVPAQAVSILQRKVVGIFDTTVIASHDATALQNWLSENGYSVPADAGPVIADYVKGGWVFVATKICRADANPRALTPQPLSFTFQTDKPVYPMRLTGLANESLSVDLYVFGAERAEAPHFTVERCAQPKYPDMVSDSWSWDWRYWSPETPDIVHPLLRRWADGLPVATKLSGQLSAADMRQDVWLDWVPFEEKKNEFLSRSAAMTIGVNWGTGLFAVGLFWIWLVAGVSDKGKDKAPRWVGMLALASIGMAGSVYLCQPKMAVRMVQMPYGAMPDRMFEFGLALSDIVSNQTTFAQACATADSILNVPQTNWDDWSGWTNRVNRNDYLGGPLREEDSPGNYTIRETNGEFQLVGYDAEGGEHVIPSP